MCLVDAVVKALDSRLEIAGSIPSRRTLECDLGQIVLASVTKQFKLIEEG